MAGRLGAAIRSCWVCRVCGGAVPVVADAGYRIAEHGVRRQDLLEGVAVGVSAVHVGVETASQGTEGMIELVFAGGGIDTEHGVQVGLTLTVLTLIGHYRFLNLVGQRCGHPVARGYNGAATTPAARLFRLMYFDSAGGWCLRFGRVGRVLSMSITSHPFVLGDPVPGRPSRRTNEAAHVVAACRPGQC
jgi:hypothetical protein